MSFLLNPYVFSAQTLYTYQGVLTIGGASFYVDNSDQEHDENTSYDYTGYGTFSQLGFPSESAGSLSPSTFGNNTVDSLYVEEYAYYNSRGGSESSISFAVQISGTFFSDIFPTLDDYPLTATSGGGSLSGIRVKMPVNLLQTKFQGGLTPTLRFALRTDLKETVGSGTITVPTGATRAIVYVLGGGGGGARVASGATRRGGGNGGIAVSDISVESSDWGTNVSYTVGTSGVGRVSTAGSGTAGGSSTFTGLSLVMTANGGGGGTTAAVGAGGTATGGSVSNTTGTSGLSTVPTSNGTDGPRTPNDSAFTGAHQGGGGGSGSNGADGAAGFVAVVWY